MPRLLLFGTGAIGSFYAWILTRTPTVELTTVCRSNFDAVQAHGIRLDSTVFGEGLLGTPAHVVRTVEEGAAHGPYDFVMVAAKALPGTAEKIQAAVGPETSIVLVQNGIDIEEDYARLYPGNAIVSVVISCPVHQPEPGRIVHQISERMWAGGFPASSVVATERAQQFVKLIADGGGTVAFEADIQGRRWQKVAGNANINPLCALTRLPDGRLWEMGQAMPEGSLGPHALCVGIMQEVGLVAASEGYGAYVDEEAIATRMAMLEDKPTEMAVSPSMLQDARSGGRLEVESILGNVVRRARKNGVATPLVDVMYLLARGLDRSIELGIR